MGPIRVVLADDHTLVRAGLCKLVENIPRMEVVGEASDGLILIEMAERLQPDVILMDVEMPGLNGLEATARALKVSPHSKVLILSMHKNEEYVRQALRHGAAGYMLKDAAAMELDVALQAVVRGEAYLSPAVSKGVLSDYVQRLRKDEPKGAQLTQSQRGILQLVAEGNSTKEIARRLNISVKTVESHRTHLMKLLDIHEVAGLARYAIRVGLVSAAS